MDYVPEGTNNISLIRLMLIDVSAHPVEDYSSSDRLREKIESARANVLVALAPYLNDEHKEQSLQTAREFKSKYFYTRTVQALMPYLNDKLKAQVLTVSRKIKDEYDRACALAAIAPHLPNQFKAQVLQEAAVAASEIKGDQEYAYAHAVSEVSHAYVLAILPYPISDELKDKALKEVWLVEQEVRNEYPPASDMATLASVRALVAITTHINGDLKEQALNIAKTIKHESCRARALVSLAINHNDVGKEQLILEALSSAREIKGARARAEVLTTLIPHLKNETKEKVLQEALSASREIKHEFAYMEDGALFERSRALAALAPYLDDEQKVQEMQEILTAAQMSKLGNIESTLSTLAPHLNNILKQQALTLAHNIKRESDRALALAEISLYLNSESKEDVQQEALSIALEIKHDSQRSHALKVLASRLGAKFHLKILQSAREFDNDSQRAQVLEVLVPHLTDELKDQVLATAREIKHELSRARVLKALSQHCNDKLISQVLAESHKFNNEHDRAHFLESLIPHLNQELKEQVLHEALYLPSSEKILKSWETIGFRGLDKYLMEYFRFMASKNRGEAIQRLAELIPALFHFSGTEIADEIYYTIKNTVGWKS